MIRTHYVFYVLLLMTSTVTQSMDNNRSKSFQPWQRCGLSVENFTGVWSNTNDVFETYWAHLVDGSCVQATRWHNGPMKGKIHCIIAPSTSGSSWDRDYDEKVESYFFYVLKEAAQAKKNTDEKKSS